MRALRPARLSRFLLCSAAAVSLASLSCGGSNDGGPIVGTVARFDPTALASTVDFNGFPFPSDLRFDGTGINLAGFPNPTNSSLLTAYLDALHDDTPGFGTNSPLYVGFSGPIDPSTLPTDPAKTELDSSPVQLIDIDEGGGFAGTKIPLTFAWYPNATLYLEPNTLAIRPVSGTTLQNAHKYALVITSSLLDAAGKPVVADALTRVVIGRVDPVAGDEAAIAITQPFMRWANATGFPTSTLELVSVFTTQDAAGTMAAARTVIRAAPAPAIQGLAYYGDTNSTHVFTGTFSVLNFQAGTPPYLSPGLDPSNHPIGGFVLDTYGNPIAQRTEQVRFALTVPKGAPPAGGWPILLYAHGTGGSYLSFSEEGANDGTPNDAMADAAAKQGLASLCMDQVLHGPRNPGCDESTMSSSDYENCVGLDFFNFINPYAGRDNTRQGGADALQLIRLAHELTISASMDPENLAPTLDASHIAFLGHSQGSLTGAPFVAAEPELTGAAFSGAGGLVTITILERKDIADFKTLAEDLLGITGKESLDEFHPVLALVQTFIEPADTINYAQAMQQAPLNAGFRDALLIEGMHDDEVPQDAAEALGAAASLPIGGTIQHAGPAFTIDDLPNLPLPINDDIPLVGATRTGAMLQFGGADDDHFTMFDDPVANCQVMGFLKTSIAGDGATIPTCQ